MLQYMPPQFLSSNTKVNEQIRCLKGVAHLQWCLLLSAVNALLQWLHAVTCSSGIQRLFVSIAMEVPPAASDNTYFS